MEFRPTMLRRSKTDIAIRGASGLPLSSVGISGLDRNERSLLVWRSLETKRLKKIGVTGQNGYPNGFNVIRSTGFSRENSMENVSTIPTQSKKTILQVKPQPVVVPKMKTLPALEPLPSFTAKLEETKMEVEKSSGVDTRKASEKQAEDLARKKPFDTKCFFRATTLAPFPGNKDHTNIDMRLPQLPGEVIMKKAGEVNAPLFSDASSQEIINGGNKAWKTNYYTPFSTHCEPPCTVGCYFSHERNNRRHPLDMAYADLSRWQNFSMNGTAEALARRSQQHQNRYLATQQPGIKA